MAVTQFGANDPRTQKAWSKKLFKYSLANMYLTQAGYMGTGPDAIVQINKDLTSKIGDNVEFELYPTLASDGFGDDGTMEGNSEALAPMNFNVRVHERGHSVQCAGKMSAKRTSTSIREAGKFALGNWKAEIMENDVMRAIFGLYNVGVPANDIFTVNTLTPSAGRIWYGGQDSAGVITKPGTQTTAGLTATTDDTTKCLFGTAVIELIKRKAEMATPKIRKVKVNGKEYYRMLIHPLQAKSLTAETAWNTAQQQANVRGLNNPKFSGAIGIWSGVIIDVYDRCPMRTGAVAQTGLGEGFVLNAGRTQTTDPAANGDSVARAVLLGAQAAVFGWGQLPTWCEKRMDAGRKPLVGTDLMYGVSKTRFNAYATGGDPEAAGTNTAQEDFGCIVIETMVVVDG